MKIAAFDFCETIIKFQTGDLFLEKFINKNGGKTQKIKLKFIVFLDRIYILKVLGKVFHFFSKKRFLIRLMRGFSKDKINEFSYEYSLFLKDSVIMETLDMLNEFRKKGYKICIVSAGYSCYISKFFDLDDTIVIANDFDYKNDYSTGKLIQKDCFGKEKVTRFNNYFSKVDIEELVFVTDSLSDEPMMNLANLSYLVKKDKDCYRIIKR